ncbi:PREDICTED: cationic amino acid transporter 4, vacuolar-like isoform X1 [Ipomoea nil]|uniref:cationic amino acid transporter 4, vacuolar-like isoform X1 n=1 Tax=Ipomoea nil TaxID=35883 RepID=UPI000900E010|nr:PREDICTED: cationic amino acid transporter 4, vacuolar-like isoform X1 [Ipomoea nil]
MASRAVGMDNGRVSSVGFRCLVRRKSVDSAATRGRDDGGHPRLARKLSVVDLIAMGVGATIGAGVYILVGTVAREHTGPSLAISFFIGGIAAALSAFCYAELACRCPSAGSAYHFSYVCIGEGVAWLIGWAMILEYTLGGAAAARGISPNLAMYFGGEDKLPAIFGRPTILGILVDPGAAVLVLIITGLLCTGIKESSLAQTIITTINIFALIFIVIAGAYLGFKTGWVGYELPSGYFPFGVNGLLAGSATVFFSYIGFDIVASTSEEVKNPSRDMPLGIGASLAICTILYVLVSAVIVGLVPYYALDPDTPVSSAFASYGMNWAVYIITTGAVTALCASLIGAIIPQPRILMAMGRDGLLPSFFSDISKHTQVPVKGTLATGIFIAALAFFMDVSQLAGMVSVGTLLAFTTVAISVLVVRYVPPDEFSFPSLLQPSITPASFTQHSKALRIGDENTKSISMPYSNSEHLHPVVECPLLPKETTQDACNELRRRKIAAWAITLVCVGILLFVSAASAEGLSSIPRFLVCGVGGMIVLCCSTVLACVDQADLRRRFKKSGGFLCPFVPFLPIASILVNTYLLINIGAETWIYVLLWLAAGALIYSFYGRTHSLLQSRDHSHSEICCTAE